MQSHVIDETYHDARLISTVQATPDFNFANGRSEGGISYVVGNVLDNDSSAIKGDTLQVTNSGTFVTNFGKLTLESNGDYNYQASAYDPFFSQKVQSIQELLDDYHQNIFDVFNYTVTDAHGISSSSTLTIHFVLLVDIYAFNAINTDTVTGDNNVPVTGNVLTKDGYIDENGQLNIYNPGTHNLYIVDPSDNKVNNQTLNGTYGKLELYSDGSYSDHLNDPANFSGSATDTFNYNIMAENSYLQTYKGPLGAPSSLIITITKETNQINDVSHFVKLNSVSSGSENASNHDTTDAHTPSASLSSLTDALDGTHHQIVASGA